MRNKLVTDEIIEKAEAAADVFLAPANVFLPKSLWRAALEAVADDMAADVRRAALALYMAGRWQLPGMLEEEQAKLWEDLRDAAGIPVGTATAAGMGKTTP